MTRRKLATCCWPFCTSQRRVFCICRLPKVYFITKEFRQLTQNGFQYGLLLFVLVITLIWLGAESEQWHVNSANDTIALYNYKDDVCAFAYPPTTILPPRPKYQRWNDDNKNDTVGPERRRQQQSSREIIPDIAKFNQTTLSFDPNSWPPLEFVTYPSVQDALSANTKQPLMNDSNKDDDNNNHENDNDDVDMVIAHCGDCGACSNPRDIYIYDQTKNSLFADTVDCAKRGLIWGRKTATNCMQQAVGFTTECNKCWVENILCDLRKCVFTCMWYGLFLTDVAGTSTLNPCTICDEKRCGPQFVKCAGANRRRSGILSDIERDQEQEVCVRADPLWWNDEPLRNYFDQIYYSKP